MVLRRRSDGDPPPDYGPYDKQFAVEVHHGGFFCGLGVNRIYMDEKVTWFDNADTDSWCYFWVDEIILLLGYGLAPPNLKVYWLLPWKDMSDGLRIISGDDDTLVMRACADRVKNFVLYFDHANHVRGLPASYLPKVVSPIKVQNVERHEEPMAEAHLHVSDSDEDSDESYFDDTDNDVEDGDDDTDNDVEDGDNDAHAWLEKMAPNTWVKAFFSTFPKCDILLNNSCEVFNKYILEARELPILSMLQRIKGQLMTRFCNKQKELNENWIGPVCPKIRKKLLKNSDYANMCYVMPAGKGIFQVQSRGKDYIVDIFSKTCDCRRWDLTGIPCNHAVACLRQERITAEDMLPACYSIKTYNNVYGFNIVPCSDKSNWEKTNGPEVQPPIYEKKVGRPPKSRRKQPQEVQTQHGTQLTRHGVIITCSWCHQENHNRAGCSLRKLGIQPGRRNANQSSIQTDPPYVEPVITQEMGEPHVAEVPPQDTMLSQMLSETSSVVEDRNQGPLPDCTFIAGNQPVARPIPPTTALRNVASLKKRKAGGNMDKTGGNKKSKRGGKKNKVASNTADNM